MNMKHDRGPTMLSVNTAADRLGVRVEVLRASAYARLIPHTVCDRDIAFTETQFDAIRAHGSTPMFSPWSRFLLHRCRPARYAALVSRLRSCLPRRREQNAGQLVL
jgi:hypothetical protein